MGDPRRLKKKYDKPRSPWRADKIEEERSIVRIYGLKNKKELWRAQTLLRNLRGQARKMLALKTEQAKKEERQLIQRLRRKGLLKETATIDDVLALKVTDLLERRLETLVFKKGFASTPNQARQLIVHGHIAIGGQKVTAPGYIVESDEENTIAYVEGFTMKNLAQARMVDEPKKEDVRERTRGTKRTKEAVEEKSEVKPEEKAEANSDEKTEAKGE